MNSPERPAQIGRFTVICLMLIYVCSGACSLIDEVIWSRLLKLIIGNTVYASSTVISVFMGGLALGALLMGRVADRVAKPLRLYAIIELMITATALATPWVMRWTDQVYLAICRDATPSSALLMGGHIVLASIILGVPTVLMGSTLPLLGRVVTRVESNVGPLVGRLYAFNTLGAAAGCFLAGFIFLRLYGVMGGLLIAGGLNLAVALGGWILHWRTRHLWTQPMPPTPTDVRPLPITPAAAEHWQLVLVGCFWSGLVSIAYELLWIRSIVHSVGAYTYVFSAVLTIYLLGNVVGTGIGSLMVRRECHPATTFALLLFCLGLCGLYYLPWLAHCSFEVLPGTVSWVKSTAWGGRISWLLMEPMVHSFVLFMVPSMVMGMGFPLLLQAWVHRAHHVGRSTATVYGINTLGAVTGGLVTGFLLLPTLGLQKSVIGLGVVTLWLASYLWLTVDRVSRPAWLKLAVPLVTVGFSWHATQLPEDLFTRIVSLNDLGQGYDVLAVKEGLNTTVSVHRNPKTRARYLFTAGSRVAGDSREYRGDQILLGHLPVLLHPDCRRVLSVGFGSGESTACQAKHDPPLDVIACVEIAPELVAFSLEHFPTLNLGDQLNERVRMIYSDARHYLHLTEDRYDVIVSDCNSIRGVAENASLFTREYFESARTCLRPGGMFMSWIDSYSTESAAVIDSIMGTLMDVYPHVTLWYPSTEPASFFVIVGSETPQRVHVEHIERELQNPAVAESLAVIDIHDTLDVLSCYIGNEKDIRQSISDYQTNSDYHPVVEFTTQDWHHGSLQLRQFLTRTRTRSLEQLLEFGELSAETEQSYRERLESMYAIVPRAPRQRALATGARNGPEGQGAGTSR